MSSHSEREFPLDPHVRDALVHLADDDGHSQTSQELRDLVDPSGQLRKVSCKEYTDLLCNAIAAEDNSGQKKWHENSDLLCSIVASRDPETNEELGIDMDKHSFEVMKQSDKTLKPSLTRDTDSMIGFGRSLPYDSPLGFFQLPSATRCYKHNSHFNARIKIGNKVSRSV